MHFKHLQNQSDHLTELQFALGLENRNFSVDDNDTVGELSTSSLIMKLDYQKWFKKFRFTTSLKINFSSSSLNSLMSRKGDILAR